MTRPLLAALSIVAGFGATAIVVAPAGATTTKNPSCSTVSPTTIRSALGASPQKPKTQTSANVLICHYTSVDLIYLLHQNKTVFNADEKSNRGSALKGIGDAAFSYGTKGSSIVSLEVLDGSIAFSVSGSSAGLAKLERLAKVMVPRV